MAPPSEGKERASSMPGLWKYPTNRDIAGKGGIAWLDGRRHDDGAEGLWRVNDTLYDFSKFMDKHPGGEEWLRLTKGTDITEAFEAHHLSPMPSQMLKKFEIRPATTKRNSPYTFLPDGFYATLRRRVFAQLPDAHLRGVSVQTRFISDALLSFLMLTAILTASFQSIILACISGTFLALTTISAHNFFHLRDHWRRYYFDLSLMSNSDWRISHALSHHLYPNSVHDLEISIVEPLLQWLPRKDKSLIARYLTWPFSLIVFSLIFPFEMARRILVHRGPRTTDLIPLIIPTVMLYYTPTGLMFSSMKLYGLLLISGSLVFGILGFNAAHHHPDIFHDGDAARVDRDWGLAQVDTVRDREDISGVKGSLGLDSDGQPTVHIDSSKSHEFWSFFLAMTNFGHHTLHHLFPSLDHAHLPNLYPALEQTLTEFKVPFRTHTFKELVIGQYNQLANNKPNPVPPGFITSDDIKRAKEFNKLK